MTDLVLKQLDRLRETAICILGKLLLWELDRDTSASRRRARLIEKTWRRLILGRSARQVEKMERERGLR